jgi:hypothetical protein
MFGAVEEKDGYGFSGWAVIWESFLQLTSAMRRAVFLVDSNWE